MKVEVPSRRLAIAWESASICAMDDEALPVLNRTALVELYENHGLRLVATDTTILVRAWVPFDDDGENLEPELAELPDESLIVSDEDHRGLGLLKYIRKLYAKEEDELTVPPVIISRRQEVTDQGVLQGLEAELFQISWHLHEDVSLRVVEGEFPDWRHITNDRVPKGVKDISFTSHTLGAMAKLGKLYPESSIDWEIGGQLSSIGFKVGPLSGLLMPAGTGSTDG